MHYHSHLFRKGKLKIFHFSALFRHVLNGPTLFMFVFNWDPRGKLIIAELENSWKQYSPLDIDQTTTQ